MEKDIARIKNTGYTEYIFVFLYLTTAKQSSVTVTKQLEYWPN